ncbi:hypothetical protein OSTOST_17943 [Ostertagia ostertagi]
MEACCTRDGSAMIWTPSPEETCQFVPVGKMRGTVSPEPLYDCGKPLIVTDQGYAISTVRRSARSASSGSRYSNIKPIVSPLLAVEGSTKCRPVIRRLMLRGMTTSQGSYTAFNWSTTTSGGGLEPDLFHLVAPGPYLGRFPFLPPNLASITAQ